MAERLPHQGVDNAAHLRIAQLGFGLALKLGLGHLHRQHRREPFADIFTGEIAIGLLALTALFGEGIQGAGEHRLKALNVGAPIHRADVVGKAQNAVGIGIHAPLQGRFHLHPFLEGIHIDDLRVEGILVLIHIGHILFNAALIVIHLFVDLALGIQG